MLNNRRISQGRDISDLVNLPCRNLSQNSPHDLPGSSFRQSIDKVDLLWRGELGKAAPDELNQLRSNVFLFEIDLVLENGKGDCGFAFNLVGDADDGSFGHGVVRVLKIDEIYN